LLATAARADVVVVAAAKSAPNTTYQLVAKPGTGIKSVADLRGKKVAFTEGTALQGYLLQALDTVGLTQHDVTPVKVPGASLAATLQSGNADAAVLVSYILTNYLSQNPGATLVAAPVSSYLVLLATRSILHDPSKRKAVLDFVGRLVKAGHWVQANADTFVHDYYVTFQHQDPVTAKKSFERAGVTIYGPPTDDAVAHQRTQADLLVGVGGLPHGFNAADQFDPATTQQVTRAIQAAGS
jgi:sulfonate transport system substrate-binding protein